ncbi:MAG: glycosyltransferase [Actinomycetota bacterium]
MNPPIVFSIDDNYFYPALVFLFGVSRNSSREFRVVLAYDPEKLSKENVDFLTSFAKDLGLKLEVFEIPTTSGIAIDGHVTSVTYARLVMLDLFGEPFIWLDVDLLPLAKWDDIFDQIHANDFAYATPEVKRRGYRENYSVEPARNGKVNQARVRVGSRYFNAGVMYLNTNKWSEVSHPESWRQLVEKADEYGFQYADQCILNYLYADTYKEFPIEFNTNADTKQFVATARILHFDGPIKPWQTGRNIFYNLRNDRAKRVWTKSEKEFQRYVKKLTRDQIRKIDRAKKRAVKFSIPRQVILQIPQSFSDSVKKLFK